SGTMPIDDCWIQYQQFPECQLRIGHFGNPFAPTSGSFIEGPMIVGVGTAGAELGGGYAPGAAILGKIGDGIVSYRLAAQNAGDTSIGSNGGPVVFARVQSSFAGVTLGAAGIWARFGGDPRNGFTFVTPGFHTFWNPVLIRGWDQRYEVDARF